MRNFLICLAKFAGRLCDLNLAKNLTWLEIGGQQVD